MKMKRSIPSLPVQSIVEAVEFYANKFGFSAPYHADDFAKLIKDDVELHLWAASDETWKNNGVNGVDMVLCPIKTGAETFLAGTASCRIEVQGIDELYEEYKKQQVLHNAATVVQQQPWGVREFDAVDLHRNLLTFYEVI